MMNPGTRRNLLLFSAGVAGLALLATGAIACQSTPEAGPEPGELQFEAMVKDLGMQSGELADGKAPEDMVQVRVKGKMHSTPLEVAEVAKEAADRSTVEAAIASDYSAFRADDDGWILGNFSEDDQEQVKALLENEAARERNKAIFEHLNSMQAWGEVEWKDYRLVLARYNGDKEGGAVLAFTETPEGWKRTNALADDETFDVIMAAFRAGNVKATQGR